ncbi:hypothetical protein BKG82_27125 [Mycobacteroides chelonae]|uniref:Uncharacterized protein n=1 Tax=Mycobacteroides chelonae TaxID=1774 RepID=A0A1S1LHZ7_MYCCH|nr:hypothetical protein [Mycobacteroides chelonae]OHU47327.1 hypothetical protein BKG82_27125 [Mycobacteroides chelonae]
MSTAAWIVIDIAIAICGGVIVWWVWNARRPAGVNDQGSVLSSDWNNQQELEVLHATRAGLRQAGIDSFEASVARSLSMVADAIRSHVAEARARIDLQIHDEVRLDQLSSAMTEKFQMHPTHSDASADWYTACFSELHSAAVEAALILAPYHVHCPAPMSSTPVGWFESTAKVVVLIHDIYQGRREQIYAAS